MTPSLLIYLLYFITVIKEQVDGLVSQGCEISVLDGQIKVEFSIVSHLIQSISYIPMGPWAEICVWALCVLIILKCVLTCSLCALFSYGISTAVHKAHEQ